MNMPAIKTEPATAMVAPAAAPVATPVVTMTPKRPPRAEKYIKMARETAVRVVPPLIVIALLMLFWELVCRRAGSTLPPPSRVFKDTIELIFDPFFDRGGIYKGLFWHLAASLPRPASNGWRRPTASPSAIANRCCSAHWRWYWPACPC